MGVTNTLAVTPISRGTSTPVAQPAAPAPSPVTPLPTNGSVRTVTPAANAGAAGMAAALAPGSARANDPYKKAEQILTAYSEGRGRALQAGKKLDNGAWSRGLIVLESKPHPEGMEVTIYSGHSVPEDKLNFNLYVMVAFKQADGKIEERAVHLAELAKDFVPNPKGPNGEIRYEGVNTFVLKESDINSYFARNAQQAPGLKLAGGIRLAIHGDWQGTHNWGNWDRHGAFRWSSGVPGSQSASAQPQVSTTSSGKLEQDLSEDYDEGLKRQYQVLNVPDGAYQSHIETEFKTRIPMTKLAGVYRQLMALTKPESAQDQATQQQILTALFGSQAADWSVKPVEKYWVKEANGQFKKDALGFVEVPMFNDLYYDSQERVLARHRVALRMRSVTNQNLPQDWLNVKPGPGVSDRGNVIRRLEVAMPLQRGTRDNPGELRAFMSAEHEPLNPFNRIREFVPGLELMQPGKPETDILRPAMQIIGRRYKFDLVHKDGLSIELSLDNVVAVAIGPDGMPLRVDAAGKPDANGQFLAISCYGQIEGELNHLNMPGTASALSNAALWGRATPGAATPQPNNTPRVRTEGYPGQLGREQERWLRSLPADAKLSGTSRIHTLKDLNDPSLTADADYQTFVSVTSRLQELLLGGAIGDPNGAVETQQKAAMGAMLQGLVPMTAAETRLYAEELRLSGELRSRVAPAVQAAMAEAAQMLARGETAAKQYVEQHKRYADDNKRMMLQNAERSRGRLNEDAQKDENKARRKQGRERDELLAKAAEARARATRTYEVEVAQAQQAHDNVMETAQKSAAGSHMEPARANARNRIMKEIFAVNPMALLQPPGQ